MRCTTARRTAWSVERAQAKSSWRRKRSRKLARQMAHARANGARLNARLLCTEPTEQNRSTLPLVQTLRSMHYVSAGLLRE